MFVWLPLNIVVCGVSEGGRYQYTNQIYMTPNLKSSIWSCTVQCMSLPARLSKRNFLYWKVESVMVAYHLLIFIYIGRLTDDSMRPLLIIQALFWFHTPYVNTDIYIYKQT
jgi:hypothetical protein